MASFPCHRSNVLYWHFLCLFRCFNREFPFMEVHLDRIPYIHTHDFRDNLAEHDLFRKTFHAYKTDYELYPVEILPEQMRSMNLARDSYQSDFLIFRQGIFDRFDVRSGYIYHRAIVQDERRFRTIYVRTVDIPHRSHDRLIRIFRPAGFDHILGLGKGHDFCRPSIIPYDTDGAIYFTLLKKRLQYLRYSSTILTMKPFAFPGFHGLYIIELIHRETVKDRTDSLARITLYTGIYFGFQRIYSLEKNLSFQFHFPVIILFL